MDPLELLSDDDGDEDGEAAAAAADAVDEEEVAAKRRKTEALDFAARWTKMGTDEAAEQEAASASLRNSFAALEQATQKEAPAPKEAPSPTPAAKASEADGDFGCEPPPDSIEIYDEYGSADSSEPWATFDAAEERLGKAITDTMRNAGFTAPTPIQAHTWPIVSSGRDIIGVAKTGSGKTLAFLLPCFAQLLREGLRPKTTDSDLPVQMQKQAAGPGAYSPEILVLAPSRELALQIETEAKRFTASTGVSTLACIGGDGLRRQQLGTLRERPECVVGTVGRIIDFVENEKSWFGVKNVRYFILDEADNMIGEGLSVNMRKITMDIETPKRQTMLFSATFGEEVSDLATWITRGPVEVRVGMKDPLRANKDIDQQVIIVKDDFDKEGALKSLLRRQYAASAKNPGKVLIFAADPEECDALQKKLRVALNGAVVETLHSNKKQNEREKAMTAFRTGECLMLIATNLAGRGLDVKDVKMVVNYDPPEDGQDYVHRIGRTGRAGAKGTAMTLLRKGPDGRAMIYIAQVMRRTGLTVPKDLIDALKQRRGRDMTQAAEVLQGLVGQVQLQRGWAKSNI